MRDRRGGEADGGRRPRPHRPGAGQRDQERLRGVRDRPAYLRGRTVAIAARRAGDCIEIVVRDSGMGLPPEELAEVRQFIPGGTSKKTYGTGFGLPFAKRKVADHGGTLQIDSIEDEGTTVTIVLPTESRT
ncbi:MAG: ATP-binding protein [Planctomycetota bacterium]